MADIDALKNRIRSNVKSNDNQEITGPVMQETLLDMTRELDPSLEEQRAMQVEAALNRGLTQVTTEVNKKPDRVDIAQYNSEGSELPLAAYYTYYNNPTQSIAGYYAETEQDFIAVCIYHWTDNPSIVLYTKNSQNKYIYSSTFLNRDASTPLEQHVARLFAGTPVTADRDGLMRATDKVVFDEMVTEVFPLTVAVTSSNAGAYEIGTSSVGVITPQINLSITRKGVNVPASEITLSVSPNPASVSPDKRTISGNQIYSGTTTFQISVSQGGQTRSVPNQVFSFLNYRYYGMVSSKPANADAVKTLCQNGTLTKQLSSFTTMGKTALAADNYFVFVIPATSPNLIVKNANSGGTVDNAGSGTFEMARVNSSENINCKYVVVPASPNAWNFEIIN